MFGIYFKAMDLYKITRLLLFVVMVRQQSGLTIQFESVLWMKRQTTCFFQSQFSDLQFYSEYVPPIDCVGKYNRGLPERDGLPFSNLTIKFTPNIHVISIHHSLQCFEKGYIENQNLSAILQKLLL